jgi:hypothetical protein
MLQKNIYTIHTSYTQPSQTPITKNNHPTTHTHPYHVTYTIIIIMISGASRDSLRQILCSS